MIFHSHVSLPEGIPFLWLNIPQCLVKSRLTPSFVWSVSMLKPFKPQILTQPQLRQLQPVLKGFAVFLACSWQSSWANVGVCGDVCMCIYIYTYICAKYENMHFESCWYTSDVVGDTGVSTKPVYEDIMGGTRNSHTHTHTPVIIYDIVAPRNNIMITGVCVCGCVREKGTYLQNRSKQQLFVKTWWATGGFGAPCSDKHIWMG